MLTFCLRKFQLGNFSLATERFLSDTDSFMVEKILLKEGLLVGPLHFTQGFECHLQSFLWQENNYNRSFAIA